MLGHIFFAIFSFQTCLASALTFVLRSKLRFHSKVLGREYKDPISAVTKLVRKWDECISVLGDHVEYNNSAVEYMRCIDHYSDFSFSVLAPEFYI